MADGGALAGQLALVTGASRGIGRAIADELAALGADIALVARSEGAGGGSLGTLDEAVASVGRHGTSVKAFRADLGDRSDVDGLADRVTAEMGKPIDILVNNAAAMGPDMYYGFLQMSKQEWRNQVEINLNVPFVLMKAVIPSMLERGGGRIVNITSVTHGDPLVPTPEDDRYLPGNGGVGAAYVATKLALNGLTNQAAYELGRRGIVIVAVHPGFTATENARRIAQEVNVDISSANPMSLPAKVVAHLASCEDPRAYNGRRLLAEAVAEEVGIA